MQLSYVVNLRYSEFDVRMHHFRKSTCSTKLARLTFYQYPDVQHHLQHFLMESFHKKFHGFLFQIVIGKQNKKTVLRYSKEKKPYGTIPSKSKSDVRHRSNDMKIDFKRDSFVQYTLFIFEYWVTYIGTSVIQSSHACYNVPSKNRFSVKITFPCLYKA